VFFLLQLNQIRDTLNHLRVFKFHRNHPLSGVGKYPHATAIDLYKKASTIGTTAIAGRNGQKIRSCGIGSKTGPVGWEYSGACIKKRI
jgi:hypothetical protein